MTALYLLPNNPASGHYAAAVRSYMEPIFSQNWGLFAPEPATSSLQFWFRCESVDGQMTDWQDPTYQLFKDHHAFPFTFRGKLTYVYQSIARDLLNSQIELSRARACRDASCLAEVQSKMAGTREFALARRWTVDLCRAQSSIPVTAVQFQVLKVFPKPYSERHKPGVSGRIESVPFEPIRL